MGGAEVWRIADTGYLSGTPGKASEEWPSEWFYTEDVALPNPVRKGLPKFASVLNGLPVGALRVWKRRTVQKFAIL